MREDVVRDGGDDQWALAVFLAPDTNCVDTLDSVLRRVSSLHAAAARADQYTPRQYLLSAALMSAG